MEQRPICPICGVRYVEKYYDRVDKWRNKCFRCRRPSRQWNSRKRKARLAYEGSMMDPCALCGYVPEILGEIELDHIDGNRNNNAPENIRPICTRCHRKKTLLESNHLNKY